MIIADIDLSCSTRVHTQHPNRLSPQLGVVVSTTKGHSLSALAPRYMLSSALLSYPQGFVTCIRNSHTSSFDQSSIGLKTSEPGRLSFAERRERTRSASSFAMRAPRLALSALRVPSTRIVSPLARTMSRTNLFAGRILSRSVHHRNLGRGAG